MEDLDTEFVVEGNEDKHEYQDGEDNSLDSPNYNQLHAIVHKSNSADDTNVQNKCPSEEKENTVKEIHWTKSTNCIKSQNDCKLNSEVLIETDPLDNPLMSLIKVDDFLQHLKLESERYASRNGRTFVVSPNELRAFIGINFVMGHHKLPTIRSYWETGNSSVSVNDVANVMTRERFKEILSNPYFSINKETLPKNTQIRTNDKGFKV